MPFRDSGLELAELSRAAALDRITTVEARRFLGLGDMSASFARAESSRFVAHARTWPWQDAGVSYQLARSGIQAHDEASSELATAAAADQAERSEALSQSIWADVDPGEALFDGDNFIGFSRLEREANDTLLSQIASGVDAGLFTLEDMNGAIRSGEFSPLEVLAATDNYAAPYKWALEHLGGIADGESAERAANLLFNLPREKVVEMQEGLEGDIAERRSQYGEGVSITPSNVQSAITGLANEEWGMGWGSIALGQTDDDEGTFQQEALDAAALARGEELPGEGGGGGLRAKVGAVLKPLVGVLDVGRQLSLNRFRQDVNMIGEGLGGLANASPGEGFFQDPTLASPMPVTDTGVAALTTGAGLAATATDVAALATGTVGGARALTAGLGRAGVGAGLAGAGRALGTQATASLGPEILDASVNPDRFQQRFDATDLGVYISNPELRGDGLLFDQDLMDLRRRREEEFSPRMANGDLLTFGRLTAVGLGAIAKPIQEATGMEHAGVLGADWLSQAANPGSDAYNTLSGLVDFGVAIAGPGEVLPDSALVGLRNARALPGLTVRGRNIAPRALPLFGSQDPLRSAGAIGSSWRNSVLRPQADEWLTGWRGRKVTNALADMSSPSEVMRAFRGRATVDVATAVADLDNADDITGLLRHMIGSEVGAVPRLGPTGTIRNVNTGFANTIQRHPGLRRFAQDLPATDAVQTFDLDATYRWANDYMMNASLPQATVDEVLDDLARTHAIGRSHFITERVGGEVFARTVEREFTRRMQSMTGRVQRIFGDADAVTQRYAAQAEGQARELTRHWASRQDDISNYFIKASGEEATNPLSILRDGGIAENPMPHLVVEAHTGFMEVPSISNIRNLGRINSPAFEALSYLPFHREILGPGTRTVNMIAEHITSSIWKPLVLLRGAYVMRVVGEEQLRIAAAGGDALVNNPAGWLAWVLTREDGRNMDILKAVGDDGGEFLSDAAHYRNALVGDPSRSLKWADALDRQRHLSVANARVYERAFRGESTFIRGWAGEMSQLSSDTLARTVALSDGVTDELVELVMTDDALRHELELAQSMAGADAAIDLTNSAHVKAYLESLDERIFIKTGGSVDLRNAIATGKLGDGDDAITLAQKDVSAMAATQEFQDAIVEMADEFAPDVVKVVKEVSGRAPASAEAVQHFKAVVDILGGLIIERPTSYLSRSPVFRQNYWDFVANNANALRADDARRLLGDIPDGLPRDLRRTLRWRLGNAIEADEGMMTLKGFDLTAKATAMNATNDLLFSMATKSQWADALRVVAPFAQAWGEILTTWGKLIPQNPNIIRRVSQARTVVGDPDFASSIEQIPGWETVDGQGLISTNEYGDEVIIIPWANAAGQMLMWGRRQVGRLPGIPAGPESLEGGPEVPFNIPLASLNVGAGFIPGIGPAISVPLARLLPENFKGYDIPVANVELREILFPFGEPRKPIFSTAVIGEFVPSWMRYSLSALSGEAGSFATAEEANAYNGKVIAVMQWLMANDRSGKYDLATLGPEALLSLTEDAKLKLNEIVWAQVATAGAGPGPTQPGLYILDEDGNVQLNTDDPNSGTFITAVTAGNLYRQFLDDAMASDLPYEQAQDAAFLKLVEATGSEGSIFSVLGKSRTLIQGTVPVTKTAYDWYVNNEEIHDVAPNTWGMFAPLEEVEDEEFYMPMYLLGIGMNDRKRLTPQEWGQLSEDLLGDYLYNIVEASVIERNNGSDEFGDETKAALTAYRQDLQDRLPGWRQEVVAKRSDIDGAINELQLVTAPGAVMEDHALAEPVQLLTETRQRIADGIREAGLSAAEKAPFASSIATASVRQQYADYLDEMERLYPEAADVIETFFRAEIRRGIESDEKRAEEG